MNDVLNEQFENLVTFFDQYYRLHGEVLSVDAAHEQYGIPKELTTKALADKAFREALEERGVVFARSEDSWRSQALTPLQLITANSLLDLVDTRSQKKKLQDLGVATSTYNAWMKDPVFRDYLQRRAEQLLSEGQHEAHMALLDRVRAGDMKAIAYFNELTGRFTQQRANSNVPDVQNLIVKIIEIIDLRVKDSDTKLAIAEDLKRLIAARNMAQALTGDEPIVAQPQLEQKEQKEQKQKELSI